MDWHRDDESTFGMLLLAGGFEVSMEVIKGWTDSQCKEAESWAVTAHLRASDNPNVKRVSLPTHMQALQPEAHGAA